VTHGHVLVRHKYGDEHHLFTHHDGHPRAAVADLVALPFLLHDLSVEQLWKIRTRAGARTDLPAECRFRGGPWYMQVLGDGQFDRGGERFESREDVADAFRSGNYYELYPSRLAHWLVQCWFDRWHVVFDKDRVSYAGKPRVVVTVSPDDDGYTIQPGPELVGFADMATEAVAAVAARQAAWPEDDRVRVTAVNQVVVPFYSIVLHLAWEFLKDLKPETP